MIDYKTAFEKAEEAMQEEGAAAAIAELETSIGFKLPELPPFYFICPASTRFHGNYEGGLFAHSYEVAKELCRYTQALGLDWERPESPVIVGLLHDICKCEQYAMKKGKDGVISWEYDKEALMPDHGALSVIIAQQMGVALTDEEIACIRWHMGAFEKDPKLWGYYGNAVENYPNVLYTHTADMAASRIKGF